MKPYVLFIFPLLYSPLCVPADPATTGASAYFNDFEHAAKGKPADDLQILNGDFSVREEAGNSFLELPGDPLDTFGLLFGPGDVATLDVSARIWADATGRRSPEFGIGSNDIGGYKLWLWPGARLRRAAQSRRCQGKQSLLMEIRRMDPPSPESAPDQSQTLASGRQSVAGQNRRTGPTGSSASMTPRNPAPAKHRSGASPFSGKPIRFDDLSSRPSE